ncbi:hypothetical protein GCM10023201_40670 [Actinomycetospora corticicola]|uniref:Uncharacterized protein n=1 Tax=Actinomycetospora corticicola TaxID=663602 RepID=A0A7Y9J6X0_9PSEU|nr:hypothetical protein [Actinomycetospora corticicola]NYD36849.1 hypothetical protein [Actinomycetospora corticicola]
MSEHLDRLVALHEAQLADLDEHRGRCFGGGLAEATAAVEQPARLRVHDLPREVVRGLAGALGVRQHGRDLEELRGAVEVALRADPGEAAPSSGRAA